MGSSQSRPSSTTEAAPRTGLRRRLSPLRRLSNLGRRPKDRPQDQQPVIAAVQAPELPIDTEPELDTSPEQAPCESKEVDPTAQTLAIPLGPAPEIRYPVRRPTDRPTRPGILVDRRQNAICQRHGVRRERRPPVVIPDWHTSAAVRRRRSSGVASEAIAATEEGTACTASTLTPAAGLEIATTPEADPSVASPSASTNHNDTPESLSDQSTSSIPITETSIPATEANTLTSTEAIPPGSIIASVPPPLPPALHRTRSEPAFGTLLEPLDPIPAPQRQISRLRVEQGLLGEEVALLRRQLDLSRQELERAVVDAAAAESNLRAMEEEADNMPGAVLMIQGIAQTHIPAPNRNRILNRWRGRARERVRVPFEEQASTITGLILVSSLATANTLLSTERPRPRPNTMLETLMRRIHPSRAFAVETLLANPAISAIASRRRRESTESDAQAQADEIGNLNMPVEFTEWLTTLQIGIREAMREFVQGTTLPLSRSTSVQPLPVSADRPDTTRRISAPTYPSLDGLIFDTSISDDRPTGGQHQSNQVFESQPNEGSSSLEVPQFHHQPGQTQSPQNRTGVTTEANGVRRLNFFRAHVFAAPEGSAENAVVPCLFVGVRSTTQDPATFGETDGPIFNDLPRPTSSSPDDREGYASRSTSQSQETGSASQISTTAEETTEAAESSASSDVLPGELLPNVYRSRSGRVPMSPSSEESSVEHQTTRPTMSRTQTLRSRLLALSPFSSHHRTSTSEQTPTPSQPNRGLPRVDQPAERQATFIMYVIGGNFPRNHPVLRIPGLITGEPLSDEEMVLMGELLGEARPPTATAEEVEKSGLQVIKGSEIVMMVEKKEIIDSSADRCLVCLSDFEDDEECRVLTCRHVFHRECVDQWIKVGRNACPACRTEAVDRKSKTEEAEASRPIDEVATQSVEPDVPVGV